MQRSFRFRIYPSKIQQLKLDNQLRLAKRLYNHLLEKTKERYKKENKSFTRFDMNNYLIEFKKNHAEYRSTHSQALQNISDRVSKAYSNFFRKVKEKRAGEHIKAGFSRFKKVMKSITYPQSGFELIRHHLRISKIGNVPIVKHRELSGKIKVLTIKREQSGKWFAIFSCEFALAPMRISNQQNSKVSCTYKKVGIDIGIGNFATLSKEKSLRIPASISNLRVS